MATELYWVDGPWPGKLALAARPRGGDWLEDEIASWRGARVDTVLSLLTPKEERDLDLLTLSNNSIPIFPQARMPWCTVVRESAAPGWWSACLLVTKEMTSGATLKALSYARGTAVPETNEQREWVERYAATLAAAK